MLSKCSLITIICQPARNTQSPIDFEQSSGFGIELFKAFLLQPLAIPLTCDFFIARLRIGMAVSEVTATAVTPPLSQAVGYVVVVAIGLSIALGKFGYLISLTE